MEFKYVCPLGGKCEEIRDNALTRCAWYVKLVGKDPQSEKELEEWRCAIAWLPVMQVEVAQTNRGQTEAIVSFRNETIKRQDIFTALAAARVKEISDAG